MQTPKIYRVTYGNGQCSANMTYEDAARELRSFAGDTWAEEFRIRKHDAESGEWLDIGAAGRLATASRSGLEP